MKVIWMLLSPYNGIHSKKKYLLQLVNQAKLLYGSKILANYMILKVHITNKFGASTGTLQAISLLQPEMTQKLDFGAFVNLMITIGHLLSIINNSIEN